MKNDVYKPSVKFLDLDPYPILSASSNGNIHFMNPSARKALRDSRQNHIEALLPANHRGLVQACIETEALVEGERSVEDFQFAWSYQPVSGEKEAYIFGVDIGAYQKTSKANISTESLALLYGLTPAEARLTRELLSGYTLKEVAKKLGVAITTVRSHLKIVFQKTGTSRQSELIISILMK